MPRKTTATIDHGMVMNITSCGQLIFERIPKPENMQPSGWGDEQYYYGKDDGLQRHWPARTKMTHPYSYDPIVSYHDAGVTPNASVYSDRMQGWDSAKYTRCVETHFGKTGYGSGWSNSKNVLAFMRDYIGDPELKLCKVIEMCNVSNGFPVWLITYASNKAG